MAGRFERALMGISKFLRDFGSGARGVASPMQSADGSYGTQRARSRELDDQRREKYPRD